jgi:hypothetical protein
MDRASARGVAIGVGLLVVIGATAGFLAAPELYEVQDRGRGPGIVPYKSGTIYEVRLLDSFTLYAPEEAKPNPDKLTSLVLACATTMLLMALLLLTAVRSDAHLRAFFGWGAAGLALLTLDETLALHELLGHNLQFLADVPGVERPDDLIFALYPFAAAIFAWRFRDILLRESPIVVVAFGLGVVCLVVAVIGDLVGSSLEEIAEPFAALYLLGGLVLLTAHILGRELGLEHAPRTSDLTRRAAGGSSVDDSVLVRLGALERQLGGRVLREHPRTRPERERVDEQVQLVDAPVSEHRPNQRDAAADA